MNIAQMIAELCSQRDNLNEAIQSLERFAVGGPKKRGRPRKRLSDVHAIGLASIANNRTSAPPPRQRAADSGAD